MKVAVKQFGFGRGGREGHEDDKGGAGEEEQVEEEEGEGEEIGSFTPSPERKPLFPRFSVGAGAPPRSLSPRNSPNDIPTAFSHPSISRSRLKSNYNTISSIALKDTPQGEQKQRQRQAKQQQARPGLCFVRRDQDGGDDVDENTCRRMSQSGREKTPVSGTTLGRLERYRFEKVTVRK